MRAHSFSAWIATSRDLYSRSIIDVILVTYVVVSLSVVSDQNHVPEVVDSNGGEENV